MLYPLYRFATNLSAPVLNHLLAKRLAAGKEDAARIGERRGVAAVARPAGKLMWLHGASVGEALSVLPLLDELQRRLPGWRFLLTTGTVTSGKVLAIRLPPDMLHQFIPWDHPAWVARFLDHWQPDAVLWLESELWPNILYDIKQRRIPAALINARMRSKSARQWAKIPGLAYQVFSTFQFVLTGARKSVALFERIGAANISHIGSLKFGAARLPVDADTLAALRQQVGNRPVIGFFSTHDNEESFAGDVVKALRDTHPDILGIIAPRKITRGREIAAMLGAQGHNVALRSQGEGITDKTAIYIADTIGEMGLWYSLSAIAVIGGSFIPPFGGQNPLEAAHFNCAILYGPSMENFPDIAAIMEEGRAAQRIASRDGLLPALQELLGHSEKRQMLQDGAKTLIARQSAVIPETADKIIRELVEQ